MNPWSINPRDQTKNQSWGRRDQRVQAALEREGHHANFDQLINEIFRPTRKISAKALVGNRTRRVDLWTAAGSPWRRPSTATKRRELRWITVLYVHHCGSCVRWGDHRCIPNAQLADLGLAQFGKCIGSNVRVLWCRFWRRFVSQLLFSVASSGLGERIQLHRRR